MTKASDLPPPPSAEQRPYSYEVHGETIDDPWHWLRDPKYPEVDDPDVLDYLKAENAYFEAAMAPHRALIDALFEEMKGRIKEDESSVPVRDGDWLYWWAFRPGAQYRSWYRKPAGGGATRCSSTSRPRPRARTISGWARSRSAPTASCGATLVDDNGSERFKLRIRDLATGKDLETVTDVAIGQPIWTSDSPGMVFTEVNDNWRSYRARFHRLGDPVDEDVTLYEETEELGFQRRRRAIAGPHLIFISTGDNATNEVRFVPAADPDGAADADLAAPGEARIFGRRRAWQIVDPDQRRPCQFPAGRGGSGRAQTSGGR